jgi:hypothetical protein
MQRRKFVANLFWLTGGIMVGSDLLAGSSLSFRKKIKGTIRANGKGLANVVVSNGFDVVITDRDGDYTLPVRPEAEFISVSTPSGYEFPAEKGISRSYVSLAEAGKNRLDFNLVPLDREDNEHQFIIWADPQVKNKKDVGKMMAESVPDVKQLVNAAGSGALLHGITVGDLMWDDLSLFGDYDKAVEQMGIPFFQCIGNHDMDYNKGGDEASDDSFRRQYGPTYYSFNRGKAHYVVMDDVRYLGKDRDYDGHISQQQLEWLKKDLAYVSKDHLLIICVHIPVHDGVKNNQELYDLLKGYEQVHIMSGHTHYNKNVIRNGIYEHNHGTVCGAWWTGPICGDGTPSGYGVYSVKGNKLTWQYKGTGAHIDEQVKLFVEKAQDGEQHLIANVWNFDPEWKVECRAGDQRLPLLQFRGFDPHATATLLGPELPKPRGFAEPKKTDHLFRAVLPVGATSVTVTVTDRFGKQYTATYNS